MLTDSFQLKKVGGLLCGSRIFYHPCVADYVDTSKIFGLGLISPPHLGEFERARWLGYLGSDLCFAALALLSIGHQGFYCCLQEKF